MISSAGGGVTCAAVFKNRPLLGKKTTKKEWGEWPETEALPTLLSEEEAKAR
jgi:hypothetical protein